MKKASRRKVRKVVKGLKKASKLHAKQAKTLTNVLRRSRKNAKK